MTDKLEESYDEIFIVLKRLQPNLNPTDMTIDFEKAAINSITKAFPLAEIHCCRFHFGQNIYRHVQQVGLQSIYNSDDNFAFQIKLLTALSFVPPDSVVAAYEELMETPFYREDSDSPYKDQIQQLVQYFETTYIYRTDRRHQRHPPLFPPQLWNVYEQTLTGKFSNYFRVNEHFYV